MIVQILPVIKIQLQQAVKIPVIKIQNHRNVNLSHQYVPTVAIVLHVEFLVVNQVLIVYQNRHQIVKMIQVQKDVHQSQNLPHVKMIQVQKDVHQSQNQ